MNRNVRRLAKGVSSVGLAVGLSLAIASTAYSAPVFEVTPGVLGEVTPGVLGGPAASFNSDFIQGNADSLLTFDPTTNTVSGSGHIVFTGFANPGGGTVLPGTSGLNVDYQFWTEYNYITNVNGTFGQAGSASDITSLNYTFFAAPGTGVVFTSADAATGTAPTVNTGGATVQTIGSGTLLDGTGGAGFTAQGGSFFNSTNSYQNTAFGDSFFTAPAPFFNVLFDEFNNTQQGIDRVGNFIGISSASGGIDFNRAAPPVNVPEPGGLALLGLGLLGLGLSRKRWSVKSVSVGA